MRLSSIVWIALLIWVLEVLFVAVLVRDDWLIANIDEENSQQQSYFGARTAQYLYDEADTTFDNVFVATGIKDLSYRLFIPTREETDNTHYMQGIGEPAFRRIYQTLVTFWTAVYQVVIRAHTIGLWAPFMLLILVPSVVDGLSMRAVKKATHTPTKVVRNRYGVYLVLLGLYVFLLSLFSPFPVGPVTYFAIMAGISLTISMILANLHKTA